MIDLTDPPDGLKSSMQAASQAAQTVAPNHHPEETNHE
jgi:hypothetical protein